MGKPTIRAYFQLKVTNHELEPPARMAPRFTFSVGRGFEPEPDEVAPGPTGPVGSGPGSGSIDSSASRSQTNSLRTEGSLGNQALIHCS